MGFLQGIRTLWNEPKGKWEAVVFVYWFSFCKKIHVGFYKTAVRAWIAAKWAAIFKDIETADSEMGIDFAIRNTLKKE